MTKSTHIYTQPELENKSSLASSNKNTQGHVPHKPTKVEELRANMYPLLFSFSFFLIIIWGIYSIAHSYNWQFASVFPHIFSFTADGFTVGILLSSMSVTLQLIVVSLILAFSLGVLVAFMNLSTSPVAQLLAKAFIGTIRNTPLLMQLYLIYFVFAPIFSLSPFFAAALALALFEGAYMAEIFRAGFKSVPHTQWEAGFSLGFGILEVSRIIVLPQAIQNVLPSLTGEIVSLIKNTSLVSAIAVADLTMRATELIAETYLSFEIWLIVALFYLILTLCVSIPASLYGRKKARK